MMFFSDSTGYLQVPFEHAIPQAISEFPSSRRAQDLWTARFRIFAYENRFYSCSHFVSFCYVSSLRVFSVQRSEISVAASVFHCYTSVFPFFCVHYTARNQKHVLRVSVLSLFLLREIVWPCA